MNQNVPSTHQIFQVIDKLVYLVLLLVGVYFVYQGDAVNKFFKKRTNFAEYHEPITELPTIITHIDSLERGQFKYGKDFNISFEHKETRIPANLTFGENEVNGSPLKVDFEAIDDGYKFKITPINYQPGMPYTHVMKYIFENSSGVSKVKMRPSAESNAVSLDGRITDATFRLALGESKFVTIFPKKIILLEHLKQCREKPFNEAWFEKIQELNNCTFACRQGGSKEEGGFI